MPELPEVEIVREGLEVQLLGKRIVRTQLSGKRLRITFPENFVTRMNGRCFNGFLRRGKYILASLDDTNTLIIHLGMSGRFVLKNTDSALREPHNHVVFFLDDGSTAIYRDPRRFGLMTLSSSNMLGKHRLLVNMGPEPLGNKFNGALIHSRLRKKNKSIKSTLLDQKVIAGLGNIYVCEALHHAHLNPKGLAKSITRKKADILANSIKLILEKAIRAGGSTLRDYAQTSGELGYFQHQFTVYGREGEPCATRGCSNTIKRIVQNGRSTYYCTKCQL